MNMEVIEGCKKGKFAFAKKVLVICLAEILGSAILLFVSCLGSYDGIANYVRIQGYLASGFAVMIVMHLFANISGAHVNPMTTICAVVLNEISIIWLPIYVISQIIGGLIGYGLVLKVIPIGEKPGLTIPSHTIQLKQALIIEMVITLILCLANCASWDKRNDRNKDSVAIRFGLLILTMNLIAAPHTGASMNPIRSFAPAFWCNNWENHWIYWIGPLSAGLIGSIMYRICFFISNKSDNTNGRT